MFTTGALIALFVHYGYAIIFPVAILEGPLVSIVGGFLVSKGVLQLHLMIGLLLIADLCGDTLYYSLGRWGGRRLAHRWGAYVGITEERTTKLEKHFKTHDWKLIFFSKTQAIGAAILFSAGVAKMDFKRFIGLNFIGSIPKVFLFVMVGYYFGESVTASDGKYLNYAGAGSFLLALLLIGIYILFRKRVQKREKQYTD